MILLLSRLGSIRSLSCRHINCIDMGSKTDVLSIYPITRSYRRLLARELHRQRIAARRISEYPRPDRLADRSGQSMLSPHVGLRWLRRFASTDPSSRPSTPSANGQTGTNQMSEPESPERRENPWTLPNALTVARILSCPWLGYEIIVGNYGWATGILFASGLTDWLDGWIARRWNSKSVLGSILDPAADKFLGTTLVVTMAWKGLIPAPLVILILGRDVALSFWAFYLRYSSLPPPRTIARYWDPRIPSAQVTPTSLSKFNTFAQLVLFGSTLAAQILAYDTHLILTGLQLVARGEFVSRAYVIRWIVGATTLGSGLDYLRGKGFKVLAPRRGGGRRTPPAPKG